MSCLWLQIKVLINVWDMYQILNLAEGTLTVGESVAWQADSKEKQ